MKKQIIILIVLGISLIGLVACGGDDSSSGDGETSVIGGNMEGATEITFWTFQELHLQLFEEAVVSWNEENPDKAIKLVAEVYPYDQMHNNLLLALQSGSGAPDIADIEVSRFPNFLQGTPQLLPMNDYVEPVLDQFIESRFDIYAKDGQYYGIDYHVGASVMYYNKDIMDQAGVDIDSILTYDDYLEAGKKVVENTDAVLTSVSTDDHLPIWQLISQRDSDWFDENGNPTLDAEPNIDTLQYLADLIHVHEVAEVAPGGHPHAEEYIAHMNEGNVASLTMPIWFMGQFTSNMPDLEGKMVIRPLPAWEEGGKRSAGMGGTGTVVTNQSESAELAQEFLAYAKLSKEANEKIWTILGFDPIRWDVWESEVIREDNRYYQYFGDDIFDTLLDIRDEINAVNITENLPTAANELTTNVFNNVIRQQSQNAEEALKEAQQAVENNITD